MAGSEPNLSASLSAVGEDPDRVLARAESEEIVAALAHETAVATGLGLFGVPAFVVEGELFWARAGRVV